ncbi:MAG TPA: FAD-dependent oxidoreductase [Bryobacteraceae bacterium]|jgi:NADPH-dependent 2,4-dienoyl-CoA reductase/sulfur reductase-like enzyme/nitrite reductase/ring-hydroxylating ferredoxin subunit|nr:FAD-dependent oxidoreductase [Bryobacteraceae bacterium]
MSNSADFSKGLPLTRLAEGGMIQGKVGEEDAILVRRGNEFFAVGASCTHYGGPLAEGLLKGDELHCPLHHACFSIRTGEALRAPAFDPIACWRVDKVGDTVFVREKLPPPAPRHIASSPRKPPASIVIVGGGAAGMAAADMLRREGYEGPVTIVSADESAPYDRPNASKEFLSGEAPEEYMPLRPPEYYTDRHIDLVLKSRVSRIDTAAKRIHLADGRTYDFGALLLATGADPVRLRLEGASDSQVHYLRTYADSRILIEKAASAKQVVVLGASFIGLEVAASLRERGLTVHVVSPENQPLERILGSEIGGLIRGLHESHGVVFHLGETITRIDGNKATLSKGSTVEADFFVLGVGVRPSLELAEQAGLKIDRGVVVNEYLETSVPGIFAAGDIARWPDARSGESIRVEHWVVAERQGQVAAKNILGKRERFEAAPFFWTRQFGVSIKYVGHADKWDAVEIEGSLVDGKYDAKDCAVSYKQGGRTLAVATIGRDIASLKTEAAMESGA